MTEHIQEKLSTLPESPGIYQMLGEDGNILYIGKAKNLKNRVRSYFTGNHSRIFTKILVTKICDIKIIITHSEKEALILENNLIKKYRPYFNIDLKDNKTYPYLCITTYEPFPRIIKTRTKIAGGIYYGPFTDVLKLNQAIELLNVSFPVKRCRRTKFPAGYKPCLYYEIKQCPGYCTGNITAPEIEATVSKLKKVIEGDTKELEGQLREKIAKANEMLDFERSKNLYEQILAIQKLSELQEVVLNNELDFDVINFIANENTLLFVVLIFRSGKLIDTQNYPFENELFSEFDEESGFMKEQLSSFVYQYYTNNPYPTSEILLPLSLDDEELEESIHEIFKKQNPKHPRSKIYTPLKGKKKRFIELAKTNARLSFYERKKELERKNWGAALKDLLKLPRVPKSIESFDIANTGDSAIVGGMVRFLDGVPDKKNYRIFNIKLTEKQDDFLSIHESVYRRYKRLLDENGSFPDIIMIDGGRGQLSAATSALKLLGIKGQPIISIAKREEEIFVPKLQDPLKVSQDNPGLLFLIKVRDETHRFTNLSHKKKRDKEELESRLHEIPGIGEKKRKILFERYRTLEMIKNADLQDLMKLPFFGKKDAENIKNWFSNN